MKIKLSTIYASPFVTAQPGSVIDVSEAEGAQIVSGKFGEVVSDSSVQVQPETVEKAVEETAAVTPPENAARRTGRGSRSRSGAGAAPTQTE
jgi:hypothetical protein